MLSIKNFLLRTSLDGCTDLRISAKLAAEKAIVRVFPRSPWINYYVAGKAAHIGSLFFRLITLGSVVGSCGPDG